MLYQNKIKEGYFCALYNVHKSSFLKLFKIVIQIKQIAGFLKIDLL